MTKSEIIAVPVKPIVRIFSAVMEYLAFIFSKPGMRTIKSNVIRLGSFTLVLFIYLFDTQVVNRVLNLPILPQSIKTRLQQISARIYFKSLEIFDKHTGSISRIDLIELSLRSMRSRKTRSVVTIGGMAIGISAIVFLVSIGYGLQNLVISRVARLDEMRQADVYPQAGSTVNINDKTISDLRGIPDVEMVLPLIAVVGKVSYQNSVSDMAVYGVTADYLHQSAIKPIQGTIFDSNEIAMAVPPTFGEVAGVSTENIGEESQEASVSAGAKIDSVNFSITPGEWIRVREGPSSKAKILGYTKDAEGTQKGDEVWGSSYNDSPAGKVAKDASGTMLGKWVTAPVRLWKTQTCDKADPNCEGGKYVIMREEDGIQVQKVGYFAEINVTVNSENIKTPDVLGVTTTASGSAVADSEFVEIASESGMIANTSVQQITLPQSNTKQAVVNRAMLNILGLKENEAVGKTFEASFIATGDLLDDKDSRVESAPASFTIVGITPDESTPVFYVPFNEVRTLGIVNYSQVKVVAKSQNDLPQVRRQIESQGYVTRSVADTVSQINALFSTLRMVLALLGTVALTVAALGMFNTLTVSLLERTREVGLMKAMGMKSSEINELFLTESMIMGLFGGLFGVLIGFVGGKLLGLFLSIFAIIKGVGYVDVSYLPLPFLLLVIGLSLIVGVVTGFYPARRATQISALNALRYE